MKLNRRNVTSNRISFYFQRIWKYGCIFV